MGAFYVYRAPAERGPYAIVSLGSDGQEGGTGTAADISNDSADAKRPYSLRGVLTTRVSSVTCTGG